MSPILPLSQWNLSWCRHSTPLELALVDPIRGVVVAFSSLQDATMAVLVCMISNSGERDLLTISAMSHESYLFPFDGSSFRTRNFLFFTKSSVTGGMIRLVLSLGQEFVSSFAPISIC